jgi:hypothetical protein
MYPVFAVGGLLSLCAVRSRIGFDWSDLVASLKPSALVTLLATVGPLAIFLSAHNTNLLLDGCAVLTACLGWILGLYVSSHPMLNEIRRAVNGARRVVLRNGK